MDRFYATKYFTTKLSHLFWDGGSSILYLVCDILQHIIFSYFSFACVDTCLNSQCIASTTLDEHRLHFEKDKALARRFQPVYVNEPSQVVQNFNSRNLLGLFIISFF